LGERGAVLAGIAISVVAYVVLGLAPVASIFWVGTGLVIIAGIYGPSVQSMMSHRVAVDEQGRLQGALSIFFGVTSLIGPVIFTNAFAWSIGTGKPLGVPAGLTFLIGAVLLLGAFAMAWVYARPGEDGDALIAPEISDGYPARPPTSPHHP
jgi:DHA1 family tetracycline resistance protein-like MFS transporter